MFARAPHLCARNVARIVANYLGRSVGFARCSLRKQPSPLESRRRLVNEMAEAPDNRLRDGMRLVPKDTAKYLLRLIVNLEAEAKRNQIPDPVGYALGAIIGHLRFHSDPDGFFPGDGPKPWEVDAAVEFDRQIAAKEALAESRRDGQFRMERSK